MLHTSHRLHPQSHLSSAAIAGSLLPVFSSYPPRRPRPPRRPSPPTAALQCRRPHTHAPHPLHAHWTRVDRLYRLGAL
ncbi:hypothetical protein CC86DRAFT_141701 [Ophiobolus disseminans]|uniref:Uncharacterized protein n=1 Tax=Ophiobolus disseminans TaxID=1469910 RepID=A0A6A7AEI7_9PLEO|nr:hypothetical protein CC86DRAFT_141701 [Ophiobolus disseminans]